MTLTLSQKKTLIKSLSIYNRVTKRVTYFQPNKPQEELLSILQKYNRILVLKARRLGVSTVIRAHQFVEWIDADEPHTYALMAHTSKASQNVSEMDARFLDNLPRKIRPSTSKRNQSIITAKKSGASLNCFTAGGKGGTRSFQAHAAHLSEFAFYSEQEEILTTVLPTVGDGQIVIESTPDTPTDLFHDLCMGAIREDGKREPGPNGWVLVFFPWFDHPEYTLSVSDSFKLTKYEQKLADTYNLSRGQIAWRRKELASMSNNIAKFKREYPSSIEEAFEFSSDFYISRESLDNVEVLHGRNEVMRYAEPTVSQDSYVMGVDVAGGGGGDYSAITVMSVTTRQPVYHWHSNTTSPSQLSEKIVVVGREFKNPKTIVESNLDGNFVIQKLTEFRYPNLWTDNRGKPWRTTGGNRLELFNCVREALDDNMISVLAQPVYDEVKALIWKNGRPDHPDGAHDDLVVSLALCLYVLRTSPLLTEISSKNIFEEFKKEVRARQLKSRKFPMTPRGGWRR